MLRFYPDRLADTASDGSDLQLSPTQLIEADDGEGMSKTSFEGLPGGQLGIALRKIARHAHQPYPATYLHIERIQRPRAYRPGFALLASLL